MATRRVGIFGIALIVGCVDDRTRVGETASGDVVTSSGDDDSSPSASTDDITSANDETAVAPPCAGFICNDDAGLGVQCDTWAQDCPVGLKCVPWYDGGPAWNATRCSPVVGEPRGVGETCTVTDSGVSGLDDCDHRSLCWHVDPRTNMGICLEICSGSEAFPACSDPLTVCSVTSESVINLCIPLCDPLAHDCPRGTACYPVSNAFTCSRDLGGATGSYGDPCEFLDVCDPGLFCAMRSAVPDCEGATGCCSEFCNLELGDPDASCAGAGQGQVCVPWFEEGMAPPALAHVGACSLPQ